MEYFNWPTGAAWDNGEGAGELDSLPLRPAGTLLGCFDLAVLRLTRGHELAEEPS